MAKAKADGGKAELFKSDLLANDEPNGGEYEAVARVRAEDGSPRRGERTRAEAAATGEEKMEKGRKPDAKAVKSASKGPQKGKGGQREAKAAPVNVRLSGAMIEAMDKAIAASPIEFGDRSEFIRRAIESELRRRGMLATYK
jgi:hypothetical protein